MGGMGVEGGQDGQPQNHRCRRSPSNLAARAARPRGKSAVKARKKAWEEKQRLQQEEEERQSAGIQFSFASVDDGDTCTDLGGIGLGVGVAGEGMAGGEVAEEAGGGEAVEGEDDETGEVFMFQPRRRGS
jgi:hypothetical protein